jgi:hypothetical protein
MTFYDPQASSSHSRTMIEASNRLARANETAIVQPSSSSKAGTGNDRIKQHNCSGSTLPALNRLKPSPTHRQTGTATSESSSLAIGGIHHRQSGVIPVGSLNIEIMVLLAPITRHRQDADRAASRGAVNAANASPIERLELESIKDQAWHGMAGI